MSEKENILISEEEERVYNVLKELNIEYTVIHHEPFFGKEDSYKDGYHLPGLNLKNLLVREKKRDEHYLVILDDEDRLDFKKYKPFTGWSSKMTFTEDAELVQYLGVHIGSASVFGLINDISNHVTVVLDSCITTADPDELINFHPNVNTATVTMKVRDLFTFLEWTKNPVITIPLTKDN